MRVQSAGAHGGRGAATPLCFQDFEALFSGLSRPGARRSAWSQEGFAGLWLGDESLVALRRFSCAKFLSTEETKCTSVPLCLGEAQGLDE